MKVSATLSARQLYQGLISQVREALRGHSYDKEKLIREMKLVDIHVGNTCPTIPDGIIDKYYQKYHHDPITLDTSSP